MCMTFTDFISMSPTILLIYLAQDLSIVLMSSE